MRWAAATIAVFGVLGPIFGILLLNSVTSAAYHVSHRSLPSPVDLWEGLILVFMIGLPIGLLPALVTGGIVAARAVQTGRVTATFAGVTGALVGTIYAVPIGGSVYDWRVVAALAGPASAVASLLCWRLFRAAPGRSP